MKKIKYLLIIAIIFVMSIGEHTRYFSILSGQTSKPNPFGCMICEKYPDFD